MQGRQGEVQGGALLTPFFELRESLAKLNTGLLCAPLGLLWGCWLDSKG